MVENMRKGDEYALTEVVRRYERVVAQVVIGMLGNTPEADDVGQETFIRFWASIANYRHEAKISTYLTRIAINLSINELKRRKRRMEWLERTKEKLVKDRITEAENSVQRAEFQEYITAALSKVESNQRAVMILRLVHGYSTKETAEILGIPMGTVLSRLSRGLEKLRDILKKMEEKR